jgi:hypothetical protein
VTPYKKKTAVYNNEEKALEIFSTEGKKRVFKISPSIENTKEPCGHNPFVPVIWLDNERLLTQKTNGELIVVDLAGNIAPFISIGQKPSCPPTLFRDIEGNLIYDYDLEYLINPMTRSYEPVTVQKQGHGFGRKFEYFDRKEYRNVYGYFYNGKKIGEFQGESVKTAKGLIAVEYRDEKLDDVWPAGIKVWNDRKKNWREFKIRSIPGPIGWLE